MYFVKLKLSNSYNAQHRMHSGQLSWQQLLKINKINAINMLQCAEATETWRSNIIFHRLQNRNWNGQWSFTKCMPFYRVYCKYFPGFNRNLFMI